MCQVEEVNVDAVIQAVIETANAMCCPEKWRFDSDWIEDGVYVSCFKNNGFVTEDDLNEAGSLCQDLSRIVESILQRYADESWRMHGEMTIWDKEGNDMGGMPEDDEIKDVHSIQQMLFKD